MTINIPEYYSVASQYNIVSKSNGSNINFMYSPETQLFENVESTKLLIESAYNAKITEIEPKKYFNKTGTMWKLILMNLIM